MNTAMSSPKPLHEILSHDQEPFLLHVGYDSRLKRELPVSPCLKSAASLRVPTRTGVMILETASRIQRSSSASARLPRKRSLGKGFLGLILKRVTRWRSKKARFRGNGEGDEPSRVDDDAEGNRDVCDENSCDSSLRFETPGRTISDVRPPEFSSPDGDFVEEEANLRPKGKNVDEEKEEREQFSPVSVLDPPSSDEDEDSQVVDHEEEDGDGDGGVDSDYRYAFVQRTKEQLLDKLQRFERLARLDPVELEKRLMDSDDETPAMEHEGRVPSCFQFPRRSGNGISKLVSDLIAEEEGGFESSSLEDRRAVIARVNKRLESWEEKEDEEELRVQWKPEEEEFEMLAQEIEVGMFQSLLEDEFSPFVE